MDRIIQKALEKGFDHVAVMKTCDLVFDYENRKYCEDNLCGNYGRLRECPPECGTNEEMEARVKSFENVLILQVEVPSKSAEDDPGQKNKKRNINEITAQLIEELKEEGIEKTLMMSAGPWNGHSCLSAYNVIIQKAADRVGMICWGHDGIDRLFTLVMF